MENLTDIAVFVRVVETGSFTKTAGQLELSRAVVSKYLNRLEARLGVRLLHRTTRRLSLTEAGMALFEASRGALSRIEDAELEVARLQSAPRGTLKVNVPMSFGLLHIAPSLPEFLKAYPELSVDLAMEDRFVNLVDEGYDLAIRITRLADSALVARKLAPCRQVVCASPAYLARHGCPSTPEDLSSHNCVIYSYLPPVWRFNDRAGREIAVPVRGNLRVNNGIASARSGAVGSRDHTHSDVLRRRLDRRTAARSGAERLQRSRDRYAVYPQRKYLSPKVRAFVEFLGKRFGPRPPWDRF